MPPANRPKIQITVSNRIVVHRDAAGRLDRAIGDLKDAFTHANPVHARMTNMGYRATEAEPPVIETWREERGLISFPRGGMPRVRDVLAKHGLSWVIDDQRVEGQPCVMPKSRLTMRDHQEAIIDALLRKQNCLVISPGASGKTSAVLKFISHVCRPALVVLWSTELLKQWEARVKDELGFEPGIVQGSKRFDLRVITLAMQQTLWQLPENRWDELVRAFGVVVLDEVQRAGARTFMQVIDRFPAKYRVGISGSEKRKDGKQFLTYDLFGSVAETISRDAMTAQGITVDVEVYVVPTEFEAPWYVRAAQSGRKWPKPDYAKLLTQMAGCAARNALLHRLVERARAEGPTLVMSHRVQHCHAIASWLKKVGYYAGLMLGGVQASEEFKATVVTLNVPSSVQALAYPVGVGTYQAAGTGIDIPPVSRLVFATPVHMNQQQFDQFRWRAGRTSPGKQDARCYVLWDRKVFGRKPLTNFLRWAKVVKVLGSGGSWIDGKRYLESSKKQRGDDEEERGSTIDTEQLDAAARGLDDVLERLGIGTRAPG